MKMMRVLGIKTISENRRESLAFVSEQPSRSSTNSNSRLREIENLENVAKAIN
jgi:hypothetical protein